MPPRKRKTMKRRQVGGSGFTDFFTKTLPNVGRKIYDGVKPVYNFVRDNKLVSRGLSLIPNAGAKAAGLVAAQAGFGRRRRRTKQTGGGAHGVYAMSL